LTFAFSDEVFSSYKFREVIPGCLPHPGDIVESGSLSVCVSDVYVASNIAYVIVTSGVFAAQWAYVMSTLALSVT